MEEGEVALDMRSTHETLDYRPRPVKIHCNSWKERTEFVALDARPASRENPQSTLVRNGTDDFSVPIYSE